MAKREFKVTKSLTPVGGSLYRKWTEWQDGDAIIAIYKGSKTDQFGKPSYIFQVEDAQFQNKKLSAEWTGKTVNLNSTGTLDRAMEQAEPEMCLQIQYNGQEKMDGGPYKGKMRHLVQVDVVSDLDGAAPEASDEEDLEL